MKNYRKKPVVIQAIQFTIDTREEVAIWCGGRYVFETKPSDPSDVAHWMLIPTLEGTMRASLGDYVIRGVRGEFYSCAKSIFEETYEEV